MNYSSFFQLAKDAGIEECELSITKTYTVSFTIFHGEVESYEINDGFAISARGLIKGKFGSASCDAWSKDKALYLVNEVVNNAKVIEDTDPMFIFKGSPKYKKINTYNKELVSIPLDKKIKDAKSLEQKVKSYDKRIVEVAQVSYSESDTTYEILNSHGLKLKQRNNYFYIDANAIAKENNITKSNGSCFFANDYSQLNIDELAKEAAEKTLSQLNGHQCESKKYKVVLDREVVSQLLPAYIASCDSEEVQKGTSLFIGKLNTKVASSKVTIEDKPLYKSLFARNFDDEGVATYNKSIIKKGKLNTYLYNLTTAAKDNVTTTGNGFGSSAKMGISPVFLTLKPGKTALEEMIKHVNEGIYITEVNGLHAGLDSQTGDFSLQASGFYICDGKITHPLDVITVSGNLVKLFKNISLIGNDNKTFISAVDTPSVVVNSLNISSK